METRAVRCAAASKTPAPDPRRRPQILDSGENDALAGLVDVNADTRLPQQGDTSRSPIGYGTGAPIPSWVACSVRKWHDNGMNRTRLSTTVDPVLLERARSLRFGTTDAALVDEALSALLARHRSGEVDASYAAYDEHPLNEPDEWGDLASFRRAAAAS